MAARDNPLLTSGTVDFSGGVNSRVVPTVQSIRNPNGLPSNALAWLVNATMRGGSLQPRDGYAIRGNINGNLPPQEVPGAPGQTIPQPPIPPIQTPSTQNFSSSQNWTIPTPGNSVTIPIIGAYVGNIGDVQKVISNVSIELFLGLVTAFSSNSLTLQCSTQNESGPYGFPFSLSLVSLGPPIPQAPIIIPPGPVTNVPAAPFFQGASMYSPDSGTPYVIAVIGGHVVQIDPDFNTAPIDLSAMWGFYIPASSPRCFFVQAENYLIIQAGDYDPVANTGTLPLFWSGSTLTQSNGLTGITSIGEPIPNFFTLTTTNSWTPAAAGNTAVLTLTAPYGGTNQHLGDNLLVTNSANTPLGQFRVIGISGSNITLQTIVLDGSPGLQTPEAFSCVLTLPPTATQDVLIGDGFWSIPAVGQQVAIDLTSLYFGSVGDIITIQSEDGSIAYGSFQVISFNSSYQLVLKVLSSAFAGMQVSQGNFLVTVTAVRAFSFSQVLNSATPWTIQPVGSASYMYWPKDSAAYTGKTYDIVNVSDKNTGVPLGTFRVIPGPAPAPDLYQVYLETLQSNFVGSTFGNPAVVMTLTVTGPPSNPQFLTLNSGQWTMPSVGSSVQLQINWLGSGDNPPEGPQYPGSVGDTVTLTQNSPVLQIGQFLVTAFDTLGNITLQAVVPTNNFTPVAAGTVIVGPMDATMVIIQAPSQVGTLISQLPAATSMIYYQGIVFYAQGDIISGGDIVGGPSGTSANNYRDAVLCVTENPLSLGGDGFKLPIPGNITGMGVPAQINAALGQGLLYIGTINGICSLQVPPTRTAWILASGSNGPQLNVVQFGNGWTSDWAIVSINGDLYFPSVEPGIRSLLLAERWFQQQGNVQISTNEDRLMRFVDPTLLNFASGIFFNNRLLMSIYMQTTPYGTVGLATIPLDMEPLSTLEEQLPANFEGMHEGLQTFQLLTATFSGKQRAFAVTLNANTPGEIDLWELVVGQESDTDDTDTERRITWQMTSPAFTWDAEADLKRLVGGEIWIDRLKGIVNFKAEFRPDSSSCWVLWKEWEVCSARNSAENLNDPVAYPLIPYPPGFRSNMSLPEPPAPCVPGSKRPANVAFQFQFRLTMTGFCRVRATYWHAAKVNRELYAQLVCG